MKKILSILLVLILTLAIVAGCAPAEEPAEAPAETPAEEPAEEPSEAPAEDGEIAKLGLGHITSIAKSKDLDGDTAPLGQVDTIIAAVGFDNDGKVVKVTIDNAQTKVNFDTDLKLTSDKNAEYKTKVELGSDYGMIKASQIGKEWFEQIAELEKWMIGKTVDEIKNMKVVEKDASHPAVPDVPELTSSVTISVEGYIAAVEEAYNNAVDVAGNAVEVGLGHEISIGKSKGLEGDAAPLAQVDTIMAATAFDADGKVARTIIDNAQTKVTFDTDGKVTADKSAEYKTKVELGEDYGMIKASQIGKEWFEQIAELEKWMAGKTISEIEAMKVVEKDASHPAVPDVPELTSSVSISVEGYIAAVAESYENAK